MSQYCGGDVQTALAHERVLVTADSFTLYRCFLIIY